MKTIMYSTEPCFRAGLCFLYLSATDRIVLPIAFRGRHPKCSTGLDLPVGKVIGVAYIRCVGGMDLSRYVQSKNPLNMTNEDESI